MDHWIKTTCPRDCYDACGALVKVRDGRVLQVRGDPEHPVSRGKLCAKCTTGYNNEWIDPKARLTQPLRRTGPKGSGQFAPVSWEEALAEIAARLHAAAVSHGATSILNAHYTGTLGLISYSFPMRFFHRLGATEVDPDTICNMAGHVALDYVLGTSVQGFDPRTAQDAACVLVWGANPANSGPHVFEHWFGQVPGVTIVVDPLPTETARAADIHLQPFPGSDAALAFALLHVLHRDGLLDREFIAAHTLGWDELEPLLAPCTPAWGEAATGVPAALIEQAARTYGSGPSLLWLGQGLQRQPQGGNIMRACALLPAVTGNFGKPGTGLLYLSGYGPEDLDEGYLTAPHLGPSVPGLSHMDLAETLADPARAQALVCWNINIAASAPRQRQLRQALLREDLFTVAIDIFQTDTCDLADIVLPAASFLEFDDIVTPYFFLSVSAQVKTAEPPGQALPNQEIFRRLAHAMGYTEPELFEPDAAILQTWLSASGLVPDFAALAAVGTIPATPEPVIPFADGAFPTPSGKIEMASARAEADGLPRLPQPWADPRPADGRLRLLSPASNIAMNASFGNVDKLTRRAGPASVTLHPVDAAARGLREGELVELRNEHGSLPLRVTLSDAMLPGVALAPKGRWPRLEAAGANVNALVSAQKSDMGESTCVHGAEVTITRGAPPEAKPAPPLPRVVHQPQRFVQPREELLVVQGASLRLAVHAGALRVGELLQHFGRFDGVVQLRRERGDEVILRLRDEGLRRDPLHVRRDLVFRELHGVLEQAGHAVYPERALDEGPAAHRRRVLAQQPRLHLVQRVGIDIREGGLLLVGERQGGDHGVAHVVLAGIGDEGDGPVLETGGARGEVAAEAPARQHHFRRVDLGAGEGVVDDRGDDVLPVRAKVHVVDDQVAALPGAIVQQHVVATLNGGRREREEHLLNIGVVAIGVDDGGPRRAGIIHRDEVARQGGSLEGDLDGLDGEVAERGALQEGGDLVLEGGSEPGIDGVAVERVLDDPEVVGRPVVGVAGADPVAEVLAFHGQRQHALGGGAPLARPRIDIAIRDAGEGAAAIPEIGALLADVGEGA
ncbi:MAG: molybdopterin-dependent oxidoreductase [Thermomicrobiales bacterium]